MANEAEQSADLSAEEEEESRDSPATAVTAASCTVQTSDHEGRHLQRTSSTSDEYITYISDPKNTEKKFPVDRKKLERLILAGGHGSDTAMEYFQRIMDQTGTLILWPSKLKVGAKSKKDPHVKVVGRPEAVQRAREIILTDLDAKSSRITLKIDIPYSEHSHVIGKEGVNIKRVHDESKCHIHFPDTNRTVRKGEKCNQVSIMGPAHGVELARRKIRELLPLVIKFYTPLPGDLNVKMLNIRDLVAPFNVVVFVKTLPSNYSLQVTLRGVVCYQYGLKLAISKLVEYFTESSSSSGVPVELHMEIPSQHHRVVIGNGGMNLTKITQETATTIQFPDPTFRAPSNLVIIHGGIDGVLRARDLLVGCLPVVLLFDLHETEEETVSSSVIGQLSSELDVFISIRPKAKQPVQSAIIKSIEQNILCVYKARSRLLDEAKQPVRFAEQGGGGSDMGVITEASESNEEAFDPPNDPVPVTPTPLIEHPPTPPTGHPPTPPIGHPPTPIEVQQATKSLAMFTQSFRNSRVQSAPGCGSASPTPPPPHPTAPSPQHGAPSPTPSDPQEVTGGLKTDPGTIRPCPGRESSSSASLSAPMPADNVLNLTPAVQDSIPPGSSSLSGAQPQGSFTIKKRLTTRDLLTYEQRKEEAQKAMKTKVESNTVRAPTDKWSGSGLSQSWHPNLQPSIRPESPKGLTSLNKVAFQALAAQETLQRTASARVEQDRYQGVTDLSDLLKLLELEKYKENFEEQEVDFDTLLTMTEEDFKEIGVTTLGARRKLQIAISEIKRLRSQPQKPGFISSRTVHQHHLGSSMSLGRMASMGGMRGVSHSMRL